MTYHVQLLEVVCAYDFSINIYCVIANVKMSCDIHVDIPCSTVSIVVVLVVLHGEGWLAWLPEVGNHHFSVSLLARSRKSILQIR